MGDTALPRESDSALHLPHPRERSVTTMVGELIMMMMKILAKKVTMRTTLEGGG